MNILSIFYFFLPAYIANMAPVIAKKLNLPFDIPINKTKLGKNKTYRGLIFGYLAALSFLYLQKNWFFLQSDLINYQKESLFFISFLMTFGALGGDALKSYFKRKKGIKSGKPWFPFDQIDLILGAILCTFPFYTLPILETFIILILTPILHFLTNLISYKLKIKDVWW